MTVWLSGVLCGGVTDHAWPTGTKYRRGAGHLVMASMAFSSCLQCIVYNIILMQAFFMYMESVTNQSFCYQALVSSLPLLVLSIKYYDFHSVWV